MQENFYVDEPVVASFFIGEFGWFIQRWQAYLRFMKREVYKDHKFILMCNPSFYPLVDDFIDYIVPLPKIQGIELSTDSYEAPLRGSAPGSLTPKEVYTSFKNIFRTMYNPEKAIEIWTPRSCTTWVDSEKQMFRHYQAEKSTQKKLDKDVIVVFPRKRERASNRNVPENTWKETVLALSKQYIVVLGGVPSGSCLVDLAGENIINLISWEHPQKLKSIMDYLSMAICSISSQSGPTHVSLLCGTPSYIIGHERERHTIAENRFKTVTCFREIENYNNITSPTIINDVINFIKLLKERPKEEIVNDTMRVNRSSLRKLEGKSELVGVEIGVDTGDNALNILQNLDIKKLYLVDPYAMYRDLVNIGCNINVQQCIDCEKEAHEKLAPYSDKVVWIKDLSENAINQIEDELDFVYIDGNHRKEYVINDINIYFDKIKDGGLIAGHDFDYPGVRDAVVSVFGDKFLHGDCQDGRELDWWTFKGISKFSKTQYPKESKVDSVDYNEILTSDTKLLMDLVKKSME